MALLKSLRTAGFSGLASVVAYIGWRLGLSVEEAMVLSTVLTPFIDRTYRALRKRSALLQEIDPPSNSPTGN